MSDSTILIDPEKKEPKYEVVTRERKDVLRELIREWRTDEKAQEQLQANEWQTRFSSLGIKVPTPQGLLGELKSGVSTEYPKVGYRNSNYILDLKGFLASARFSARNHKHYQHEYSDTPLLLGRALAAYLRGADTNFAEFFYISMNTVYLRDTSPEGILKAVAVLPFTYFQSTGVDVSVMPALKKTDALQYSSPLLRACFFYQGEIAERLVEEEVFVHVLGEEAFEYYKGEGEEISSTVFTLGNKRVRYVLCAESTTEALDLPEYVREWIETLEESFGIFPRPAEVQQTIVPVKIMYDLGELICTQGEGTDCRGFEHEGIVYSVSEGEGTVPIDVPALVRSRIQAVYPVSNWVTRDMTQLITYKKGHYSDIQASHVPMAKYIVAQFPPDAIVVEPGAGTGLFSRLWEGEGYYGDLVVTPATHEKVREEQASETVARAIREASDPSKIIIVNSFISRFYTEVTPYPTIWIDHDFILDRVPSVERVSEALFTTNCSTSLMIALDRYGRRKWRPYHLPYTRNIRHLRALTIRQLSRAALEVVRSCPTLRIYCPSNLESYMLHSGSDYVVYGPGYDILEPPVHVPVLATTFAQMEAETKCYFVPIGKEVALADAYLFTGKKPVMLSRALYYVPKECRHRIPEGAISEEAYSDSGEEIIYFALPEDVHKVSASYRVGKDFFKADYSVIPSEDKEKWAVEEVVRAKLTTASTRDEVRNLLEDLGVPPVRSVVDAYVAMLRGKVQ